MANLASFSGKSAYSNDLSQREAPRCLGASLNVLPFSFQFSVSGWQARSLGLSNTANSHNVTNNNCENRADRGSGGITSYGRKYVRAGSSYLEQRYGKSCLTFGTLTLPRLFGADLELCNKNWHDLVRKFVQELKRLLRRRGLAPIVVHVSEIQEERLLNFGECAMHLHYLHQGRFSGKTWGVRCDEIRQIWCRLLENLLGHPIEDNCIAATRIERVRCSAAQYLSKYMSKGSSSLAEAKEMGFSSQLPAAWWGMTNALKSLIKDFTHTFDEVKSTFFLDNIPALYQMGIVKWFFPVHREVCFGEDDWREVLVGYVGQLSGDSAIEFLTGDISLTDFDTYYLEAI
jgi:hypothetical protein